MKRFQFTILFLLLVRLSFAGLMNDILDEKFCPKGISLPQPMQSAEFYSMMVHNNAILRYSYKTGNVVDTIFSLSRIEKCPIKSISGYELSPNEAKLLVYTKVKKHSTHSFSAEYYVYDLKRDHFNPLSENGPQEVPLFSPDSRYIAFSRNNNLFLKKLDFNTESAITTDGKEGSIINGTPDWLYEEEFGCTRHFAFSPDSKMVAFIRFDESKVQDYTIPMYLSKPQEDLLLYPSSLLYKYPKAGENNASVSVCVYDDFYKNIKTMKFEKEGGDKDYYIPRIKWTQSNDQLAIFKLNRNQNQLDMFLANPKSTLSKLIWRQQDERYIDYSDIDYIHFSSDNTQFVAVSEKDGYRHAYLMGINGIQKKQITKGNWDISNVYGYDDNKQVLYFQSTETSPLQRDIYSIDSKGRKLRLTDGKGTHEAQFNSDFSYFIDNASAVDQANSLTIRNNSGTGIRSLVKNEVLSAEFKKQNQVFKEFFNFNNTANIRLNGWMIKPQNFDPNKKYPVVMVLSGDPGSQKVLNQWGISWEYLLAEQGYVVVCVDSRGTGGRGSEFRKCTYEHLNKLETQDQLETAQYLSRQSFIDKDRLAICGWGFGASVALSCVTNDRNVFKAGIAIAPITDFRLYYSACIERYMGRPQENFSGYDQSSILTRAPKLAAHLLLIHGTGDEKVHVQNTLLFADKLTEADKQFEMQLYTDKDHQLSGTATRTHLYKKILSYLEKNL